MRKEMTEVQDHREKEKNDKYNHKTKEKKKNNLVTQHFTVKNPCK
jgi:hypothetical protein